MVTYYVHPIVNKHICVTRIYGTGKKAKKRIAFQIDLPGRWFENEYNCHVDGCDYPFDTLEKALIKGAEFLRLDGDCYEFVYVEEEFDIFQ